MRHALTLALQDYEGGVILVSHDRALLRATCDKFVLVANGKAEDFDGDLEDYKLWLTSQKSEQNAPPGTIPVLASRAGGLNAYAQNKADRQARILLRRPLLKETEQLEKNLEKLNQEKTILDTRAGEATLYDIENKEELQSLLKRQAELVSLIDQAEMRWLELHEQLECLPEIN
jgi:ATP-binding cassette subfamily F protein 3